MKTSHQLARELLALEDKIVLIVRAFDCGTIDHQVNGSPWEDPFGFVRIQVQEKEYFAAKKAD